MGNIVVLPDKSVMHFWRHDKTTQVIMEHLHKKFAPRKPHQVPLSWEKEHIETGWQQVIEEIERICGD